MILLLTVATLVVLGEPCQEIRLIAEDGAVVVGRSMEFYDLHSFVLTEPKGTQHTMPVPPNCEEPFRFVSKYHSLKTKFRLDDIWSKTEPDGMNSAGLSYGALYFPKFSHFPEASDVTGRQCTNAMPHIQLGEYILASFGSVQEIREAIESDEFPMVYAKPDHFGMVHPIHYEFIDTTGDGMVLEYTKEGRKTHNNTVGVFTNSPTYDWHMENLRNYPHLQSDNRHSYDYRFKDEKFSIPVAGSGSGLSGMPGDYTAVSRFVKAATLLKLVQKPSNRNEALWQSFHLMNAADIPKGIITIPKSEKSDRSKKNKKDKKSKKNKAEEGYESDIDFTSYIVVKSLTEGCMYFRGYVDISIRRICFDDMRKDVTRWVPIEGKWKQSYQDVNVDGMDVFEFDEEN